MIAYLSEKADNRIIDSLIERGFEVKLLSPFNALSEPVSSHADMLLLTVGGTLFIHKDYDLEIKDFDKIININEPISEKYPNDILLNIAIVGKNAFANTWSCRLGVIYGTDYEGAFVKIGINLFSAKSMIAQSDNIHP